MASNRIAGITIEIGGDTTKLTKALKDTDRAISNTQKSLKDINNLLKLDPKNTELLTQKQKNLEKAIKETKDRLTQLKDAQKNALTTDEHDALQREIIETQQKLKDLEKEFKDFGSIGKQQIKAVGEDMKEFGKKVGDVGKQLTEKVTVPIMAIGAAAAKSWADVDEGLDTVTVKTGATGEQLEELQELVKEIPQEINVSFGEAGEAIGEVNTRFGLTGEGAKALSMQFLKFANINKTDVTGAIDGTQKVMAAFGLKTEDAYGLLDTFNAVGQRTGIGMDVLMNGLTANATAFAEMGFSASDAANFLGDVEVSGIDTTDVMAGLKKAVSNAAKEGKPMSRAMGEIEYAIKNADTETEAINFAIELFGSKSGPAIAKACRSGQLSFKSLGTSITDNMGNVSQTFDATQDPIDKFATTMNTLKLVGADLMDTIGQMLIPVIKSLAEKIKDLKKWWEGLTDGQKESIIKIIALVAALGPLMSILGPLITLIGSLISGALNPMALAIGAVIAVVVALAAAIAANWDKIKSETKKAFNAVGKTMKTAWNGIKNTVTSAGKAIVTGTVSAWTKVKSGAVSAWNTIKTGIGNAWNGIKTTVSGAASVVASTVSNAWSKVKSTTSTVWNGVKTSVSNGLGNVKSAVSSGFSSVKNAAQTAWNGVKTVTASVWNSGIVTTVRNSASSIVNAASAGFSRVRAAVMSAFNSLPNAIRNVFSGVVNFVGGVVNKLKSLFNFRWELPRIKLPHFNITGKFSLNPPQWPRFSIQWYKKAYDNAVMFNSPTVVPTATGLKGFGDGAGGEIVMGLNKLRQLVGSAPSGDVTINVYAPAGMNVAQLADAIQDRFIAMKKQREAAYA